MKMSKWILLLLFGIAAEMFPAVKIVPLPGLLRPDSVTVEKKYIYITDFPHVYIFDKGNFNLVNKFGRSGEGPQEFRQFASVFVRDGDLVVCDLGKALFYTMEGKYKSEVKSRAFCWRELMPVGKKFIGKGRFTEKKTDYISLNIYDGRLNQETRLLQYELWGQSHLGKMNNIIDYRNLQYIPYKGKIFVKSHVMDFIIDVYDTSGKKLYTIQREYEKIPVTDADVKRYHDYFRTYSKVKRNYREIKKNLAFYNVFPAVQTFTAADDKLYVATYKKKKGDNEVLVLDLKGKLITRVFLPLFNSDELFFRSIENNIFRRINNSTFAVSEGKLYRLMVSGDDGDDGDENWELHVTDIR